MPESISVSKMDVLENSRLNHQEFAEKKVILQSYPRALFIQLDAPCNQDCLFCSMPETYSYFDIDSFKNKYGKKLETAMSKAERINLTGSGELLLLPEVKKILAYFNAYKYSEKMFATNGSSLTPKMIDFILESENKYTIHVSLHSSKPEVHEIMTKSKNYNIVKSNLEYLREVKKANLTVNFIFLATSKNIDDLPGFVGFAKNYGADVVIVYYNYVYRLDQKEISCYFIKEKTDKILNLAEVEANKLQIRLCLPPKFSESHSSDRQMCSEAWSQLMINPAGDIITCDVAGDSKESLSNKEFRDVWNSEYYTGIRKKLLSNDYSCSEYCIRANPISVNNFRSHVITRGKTESEISKMVEQL